jgi:tRNA threonylcarbamoyladenosine biosynthesis protein TsaB
MKVLAVDSAGGSCSAALVVEGAAQARRIETMERGHAQRLAPMVREVMAEAGLGFAALDLVAVTVGPGAFTGIRIGLALARGIGLAAGLPVLGVTSFEAWEEAVGPGAAPLLVALDSRRDEIFVQLMPGGAPASLRPDRLASAIEAPALRVAGDAAARAVAALRQAGRAADAVPGGAVLDPVAVARAAAARWLPGLAPAPPAPLYLRAPDITLPAGAS